VTSYRKFDETTLPSVAVVKARRQNRTRNAVGAARQTADILRDDRERCTIQTTRRVVQYRSAECGPNLTGTTTRSLPCLAACRRVLPRDYSSRHFLWTVLEQKTLVRGLTASAAENKLEGHWIERNTTDSVKARNTVIHEPNLSAYRGSKLFNQSINQSINQFIRL